MLPAHVGLASLLRETIDSCHTCKTQYMGVSKNQGPEYKPQNSKALIIRASTKRTPNLWKQPQNIMIESLGTRMARMAGRLLVLPTDDTI